MRLAELLRELPVEAEGGADVEVRGLTHDSRRVEVGDLFVALPGEHFDGRAFAAEAQRRGAVAVLGRGEAPGDLEVPWVTAEDPRRLLPRLAARIFGHPEERLRLVGVTGTNGKSTVVALVAAALDAADLPAGRLGTLGIRFGDWEAGSARTTPEASDLYRALAEMADRGARCAVMEVSSHALEMRRVDGLAFDVAVFTNLTRDHLDFHGDLESYYLAKRRLFDRLRAGGTAVVVLDGEPGVRLAGELRAAGCRVLGVGPGGEVAAERVAADLGGLRIEARTPRGRLEIRSSLRGGWNVPNLLAAAAAGQALGIDDEAIVRGLEAQGPLPGRMEPVEVGQSFAAFVDYAHTPAALEAALRSLRELVGENGRIALVFGCGGERDRGKREPMGRIAGELADLPVATSDNPRGEDPQRILSDVETGLAASGNGAFRIVPDRSDAIRRAVRIAVRGEGWAVLVAGKGHESTQTIGDRVLPFSDRDELRAAIEEESRGRA